jgi:hypothetical protein
VKIIDYPRQRQFEGDDCGIVDVAMGLAYFGKYQREDRLIKASRLSGDGLETVDLTALLDHYGQEYDAGVLTLDEIRSAIDSGLPVILAIQAYADDPNTIYGEDWNDGHYVTAIGYYEPGDPQDGFIFADSSSWERTSLTILQLLDRWHDMDSGERLSHWGCILKGTPVFSSTAINPME